MPSTQYGAIIEHDGATATPHKHKKGLFERIDFRVTGKRYQLFEITDREWTPNFIKRCSQAYFSKVWTHRVRLLQWYSPAEVATKVLLDFVSSGQLTSTPDQDLTIVDFCSGAGGPTPTIEKFVNTTREAEGLGPVQFLLTDKHPRIDAWMRVCDKSDNLNFIPQSVDAMSPPPSVVNDDTIDVSKPVLESHDESGVETHPLTYASGSRIFRLYFNALHHFTDETVREMMRSQLRTSDGFAVFEVQDRRFSSFLSIPFLFPLVFPSALIWFWNDPIFLIFTFFIPILPSILLFDSIICCLRTRTWEEVMTVMQPIFEEEGFNTEHPGDSLAWMEDALHKERDVRRAESRGWEFYGGTQRHTIPFGRMHYVVGMRKKPLAQPDPPSV